MNYTRTAGTIPRGGYAPARAMDHRAAVESGSQAKSERNHAIDALRGLCVVSMMAGHFGADTVLKRVTHLPRYFDGAIGFIFLSGFVLGLIHERRVSKRSESDTNRRILKRAGVLWIAHLLASAAILLLHSRTGRVAGVPDIATLGGWPQALWLVATLRLQPFGLGLDVLPLYILFLIFSPMALWAIRRRASLAIGALSFGVWLYTQSRPDALNLIDPRSGAIAFYWSAWQFPFVLGLLAGYHRGSMQRLFSTSMRPALLTMCAIGLTAGLVFAQYDAAGALDPNRLPLDWLFRNLDKPTLGALHLLYFLCALPLGYLLLARLRRFSVGAKLMKPFETLGTLSLYCFLIHLAYIFLIRAYSTESWPAQLQECISLVGLCFVYFMARYRLLLGVIPN